MESSRKGTHLFYFGVLDNPPMSFFLFFSELVDIFSTNLFFTLKVIVIYSDSPFLTQFASKSDCKEQSCFYPVQVNSGMEILPC